MKNIKKIIMLMLLSSLAFSLEFPKLTDSEGNTYDLSMSSSYVHLKEEGNTEKPLIVYDISLDDIQQDDFKMTVKVETGDKKELTLEPSIKAKKMTNKVNELKKELHLEGWKLDNTTEDKFRAYVGVNFNDHIVRWDANTRKWLSTTGLKRKVIRKVDISEAGGQTVNLALGGDISIKLDKSEYQEQLNKLLDLVEHVGGEVKRYADLSDTEGSGGIGTRVDVQEPGCSLR
jgi:hypothetical protein